MAVGKMAKVLLDNIQPYLQEQEAQIIQAMKSHFRLGTADHVTLISHVGKLVALEDLQSTMGTKARMGEKIHKEIENGRRT